MVLFLVRIFSLCICLSIILSCQREEAASELVFEHFTTMNDRLAQGLGPVDPNEHFFLVTGFSSHVNDQARIDSFMCSLVHVDTLPFERDQSPLQYYFFSKTKVTNNENIAAWPREFFRHSISEDAICKFVFGYNKRTKYVYKEGSALEFDLNFSCE